jgi:hypothetical protein
VNLPQHTVAPAWAAVRGIPTRWGQELPLVLARARTSEALQTKAVYGTRWLVCPASWGFLGRPATRPVRGEGGDGVWGNLSLQC